MPQMVVEATAQLMPCGTIQRKTEPICTLGTVHTYLVMVIRCISTKMLGHQVAHGFLRNTQLLLESL